MNLGTGGHLHTSSCRLTSCSTRTVPRCTVPSAWSSTGSRVSWHLSKQSRRCHCNAKKSKRKRKEETFEERPSDPVPEAFPEQDWDTTVAEQADVADTSSEVYEENLEQETSQYQQTQAIAPTQPLPRSDSSDMAKLGGLAVGAIALVAAIAFAVKKFANRKLPDGEKVMSWL